MDASSDTSTDADGSKVEEAPVVELPLHVTEKILCHISPLESARLATVCKSWAATVSARLAMPVPHLFVCTPPQDNKSGRHGHVVSVQLDEAHSSPPSTMIPSRVRSSDTKGMRCIGAAAGSVGFAACWWSGDVVLVNPITGALQTVGEGMPCGLDPQGVRVLAAGPGGTLLFAVDHDKLMLWRKPDDGDAWAWRRFDVAATLHHTANIILSAVNCNRCFYVLHENGRLSRVHATNTAPLSLLRMEKLPVASLKRKIAGLSLKDEGRLLESDGEVLFVRQLPASNEEVPIESLSVPGFEVYRLDLKERRWTKVNNLAADQALFVSAASSFAVRASDTPGCRSNCIYFVYEKRDYASPTRHVGRGSSWGVYSMEDRRVLFQHRVTEPGSGAEVFWFLPTVV